MTEQSPRAGRRDLRVVFDTVIFVRSLINPRSRCGRLVFAHAGDYRLIVSEPIVAEVLDVLHRPEITHKYQQLSEVNLGRVIEILGQADIVEPFPIPATSRDPDDDKFLGTAVAGSASLLITEDQDLLSLKTYQGIRIVNSFEFLALLESLGP